MSVFNSTQPVQALVNALQAKPVVALGDAHWYGNVFDRLMTLVLDPEVLELNPHFVLEMGAKKHQRWLDQYIALQVDDDLAQLQSVLMDSLVFTAWLAPHYLTFFQRVRSINTERNAMNLPLIQVHLTEPEFDWGEVHNAMDYRTLFAQRDTQMAKCVCALSETQQVIVICGAWHLLKRGLPAGPRTFASQVEESMPGKIVTIWPHIHEPLDTMFESLTEDTLFDLASHELGGRSLAEITKLPHKKQSADKMPKISSAIDGYLYFGPQKRRWDYDFSVWQGVDKNRLSERVSVMNPRQQDLLQQVLMTL